MAIGFVLISVEPGKEADVYRALQDVQSLAELHPLFGEYDLLAKVEAADLDQLGQLIVGSIRTLPGVVATKTLTVSKL